MHGITRLVSVISAACATVLAVGALSASAAAQARWIVFSAQPAGAHAEQLFRIRSTGAGLKQITKGTLPSIAPAFSPDGKHIAFARLGVGILAVNLDGTGLRRLTTNGRDSYPNWAPDGKSIAFVRAGSNGWNLTVMSASGSGQRRLVQAPSSGRPSWTARGLVIPSGGDLLKIDPRTGHVQKYFGAEIDAVWGLNTAAVAPDLGTLTFVGARQPDPGDTDCGDGPCPRFALYTQSIRAKVKAPRLLVKNAGPATFSSDGKQLVYVFGNGITVRSLASGASRLLKTGKASPTLAAPPAWQPR